MPETDSARRSCLPRVCQWCSRPTQPIWVHGHAQCEHCRINIDPCCAGDEAIPARLDGEPDRCV